jgi:hypothetical protein
VGVNERKGFWVKAECADAQHAERIKEPTGMEQWYLWLNNETYDTMIPTMIPTMKPTMKPMIQWYHDELEQWYLWYNDTYRYGTMPTLIVYDTVGGMMLAVTLEGWSCLTPLHFKVVLSINTSQYPNININDTCDLILHATAAIWEIPDTKYLIWYNCIEILEKRCSSVVIAKWCFNNYTKECEELILLSTTLWRVKQYYVKSFTNVYLTHSATSLIHTR